MRVRSREATKQPQKQLVGGREARGASARVRAGVPPTSSTASVRKYDLPALIMVVWSSSCAVTRRTVPSEAAVLGLYDARLYARSLPFQSYSLSSSPQSVSKSQPETPEVRALVGLVPGAPLFEARGRGY